MNAPAALAVPVAAEHVGPPGTPQLWQIALAMRERAACDGCGHPRVEHNDEDRATCAEVLRELAADEAS